MSQNRTLAKNSIVLYIRLIITTVIGLYSSRIILLELGADNFGLYAVVGGLVSVFNMLSTTMISTSNRFIAFEIGKNEHKDVNKVFNTLLVIHLLFGVILFLLIELIGVWYVKNYLNVDSTQIKDAVIVLRLSTVSAVVSALIIPFQGLINAHEKFTVRATVEIVQSILNLGAVLILTLNSHSKLRLYALLVLVVQLIVAAIYLLYSKRNYPLFTKWCFNNTKKDYKAISSFFGWQLVYVAGTIGSNQGGALIMNSFFGTVLNAAYGIASRVNEFVFSFVKNLNQAAVPQIIKGYSGGNQSRSLDLVYLLSKYTFFIMLIPSVPIILSIDEILVWWLKDVPPYTAVFVVLRIIHGLISCLQSGFDASIDATGRIRSTKLVFSFVFLLLLPVIYLFYKLGLPPYIITVVYIVGEVIFMLFQLLILKKLTNFKVNDYLKYTIVPVGFVTLFVFPQFLLRNFWGSGLTDVIIVSSASILLTIVTVFYIGLNNNERSVIVTNILKFKNYN